MDSMIIGKLETQQSDCRLLIPSVAVNEGWKCGNTSCFAFGKWFCMYNW